MKYIGWTKGNTINFITATTLARYKLRTIGVELKPFTFGPYTIVPAVKHHSPCYLVGSFEGGEIDALVKANVKATAIVKVYDRKYRISRKTKIGKLIIYPVLRTNKFKGLEYLATLVSYFELRDEEVRFFEAMMSMRNELARILTITDAWIPAYELFTSFEAIDDPNPADIAKIAEHLKKQYGYDEKYTTLVEEVKSSLVADYGDVVAIDLGDRDPKKYMIPIQDVFHGKKAMIVISRMPKDGAFKILVLCPACNYETKKMTTSKVKAECRGGAKRFTLMVDENSDLEAVLTSVVETIHS